MNTQPNATPDTPANVIPPGDEPGDATVTQETETALLQKVVEYKNMAMRATADYRNLQRETDQRLSDMRKFSTQQLLIELCPLVDYFDSAFAVIPADQATQGWIQGVRHIQDYLMQILRNHQVERMTTVGQPFNPELHESVSEEESTEPEHTIIKEVQAGWLMNGKVIRHARVIIAKTKDANTNPDTNQNQNSSNSHN